MRASNNTVLSHLTRAILTGTCAAALLTAIPIFFPHSAPVTAQGVVVSVEFRTALSPYGAWRSDPRWGEVWVPARLEREWRPYTVGHWVYSEDYGWYWVSEEEEAEWGWVTFHYGRWVNIEPAGWAWVPGNVWGPAWVDWRRGDEYVGWAPLPPDSIIVEYREDPRYWLFVRTAQLISPRIRNDFVPFAQRQSILQRTVVVNRTVVLSDRRFAVNPGIEPRIIAAAARQPVRTFQVRPSVIAGTANIPGAIQVRTEDLRRGGNRPGQSIVRQTVIRQTNTTVQPAQNVPSPQPLTSTDNGRLGDNPPRAAGRTQERGTSGTTPPAQATPPLRQEPQQGSAPSQQQQRAQPPAADRQPPAREERNRMQDRSSTGGAPGTSGGPANERRQGPSRDERGGAGASPPANPNAAPPPAQRREGPGRDERGSIGAPPSTTGAAPPVQRPEIQRPQQNQPQQNQPQQDRRGQAPVQAAPPPAARAPQAPPPPAAAAEPPKPPATTGAAPHRDDKDKR